MKKLTVSAALVSLAIALAGSTAALAEQSDQGLLSGTTARPATGSPVAPGQPGSEISLQDRTFARDAASGGMLEVELGLLAAERAHRSDVKAFGQHMVAEHRQANDRLKTLSVGKGIELPQTMDPQHRETMTKLSGLSGEAFDREYMEHMVKDHETTVTKFKQQAESGSDADLRLFAKEALSTLEEHLEEAQAIEEKTDDASADDASSSALE